MFDATWPGYLEFGSSSSIKKLGDILNYGKAYLMTCTDMRIESLRQQLKVFNLIGDPTLELQFTQLPYVVFSGVTLYNHFIEVDIDFATSPEPGSDLSPVFVTAIQTKKLSGKVIL